MIEDEQKGSEIIQAINMHLPHYGIDKLLC